MTTTKADVECVAELEAEVAQLRADLDREQTDADEARSERDSAIEDRLEAEGAKEEAEDARDEALAAACPDFDPRELTISARETLHSAMPGFRDLHWMDQDKIADAVVDAVMSAHREARP